MRPLSTVATTAMMGAALAGGVGAAPSAQADDSDGIGYAINGTFAATSDGNFATTNYAFHDEATVRSTWTISSTCAAGPHCTGQVSSDQGWTAPLRNEGTVWYVELDVPNWQPCSDGTALTGHQTFQFYPANANGVTQIGSPYLEGKDKTVGPRYPCGNTFWYGKPLTIVMPFHLDKIG